MNEEDHYTIQQQQQQPVPPSQQQQQHQNYPPSMMIGSNGGGEGVVAAQQYPLPSNTTSSLALENDKLRSTDSNGSLLLPPGWNKAFYAYQPISNHMNHAHPTATTTTTTSNLAVPPIRMATIPHQPTSNLIQEPSPIPYQHQAPDQSARRPQRKRRRPPHSYASMIAQAILTSAEHRLTLREIYEYVQNRYPRMYEANEPGWQNTIRHNLSLNRCFYKQPRSMGKAKGKGGYWCVDIAELNNTTFGSQILASGMFTSSIDNWQEHRLRYQQQQQHHQSGPETHLPNTHHHPDTTTNHHRNFWIQP